MGRPARGYYTKDGERVPSVTTVISRFKNADALLAWAWREGKEGRDFRETRDAAASAGSLAHAAVEAWVRGKTFTWSGEKEIAQKARIAFGAFKEWAAQTKLKVTHPETPLVSEKHRFGGTFDALLMGKKRVMGDWKTARGVYTDYLVQLAAYGQLWDEHHPNEPITGGYVLVRFDKEHGDFSYHWWPELNVAWEAFLLMRKLWDLEKALKERVK